MLKQCAHQIDEVVVLNDLQELDDATMGQAAQNGDLSLDTPLVHCLLQQPCPQFTI